MKVKLAAVLFAKVFLAVAGVAVGWVAVTSAHQELYSKANWHILASAAYFYLSNMIPLPKPESDETA